MRLSGLTLRRYGPFEEMSLDFDPKPGCINLVLAPNGAGKSVLRHAFGELLFGIGGQTPMGFRHGYGGMQLSATGLAPDGSQVAFTRRKGLKNTLTDDAGAALEQSWLDRLTGRADAKLLAQIFALDTERLRQGGRDLLSSGGILADALLAAAGGLREASALRRTLEEERDRLAPVRKTATRPFYVALDRWLESRRQLKDSLVRPREWAEREKTLRDAELLRDESNQSAADARKRLRRLERVRRVRPLLTAHAAASAWLAANPHAPWLAGDLAVRLPAARGSVAHVEHTLEAARMHLVQLDSDIAAVVTDDALIALTEDVRTLMRMAALVEQAITGLPSAEAELAEARNLAKEKAELLGHSDVADPARLVPPPSLVTQLRRLLTEHAAREAVLAGLPRRAAELQARLDDAERAVAALPPPEEMQQLQVLLDEIRRDGDPARNLAAATRSVAEAEAHLAETLARLPMSLRDPDELAALDPPTLAKLERLAGLRGAAGLMLQRREEDVLRTEALLAGLRAERAALEAIGVPPTREELARSRAHREAGWHLIFRQLSGEPCDPDERRAYGEERPLALAYADAVAAADHLADARWMDAERVARAERLIHELAERNAELASASDGRHAARDAFEAAEATWETAVGPLGLDRSIGLPEVQRVLAAREAGLTSRRELATFRAGVAELETRQQAAAARLMRLLGEADGRELPVLLDRAEASLRQRRAEQDQRREYQAAAAAARDAQRDIERERMETADELARWQSEWNYALDRLGQTPDLPPSALDEVLNASDALAETLRQVAALDAQASAWRATLRQFREGYASLCGKLGMQPDPDALAGLRNLDHRQQVEVARAERRATLLDRREMGLAALRQQEEALARAEAELRAVLAEAGAVTAEAAEERIALSAERARQDGLRTTAEADLLVAGDGLDLDALRAEADAHPTDGLEAALEEAEEAQRHHAATAQAQVATVTALELELQRLAGDDAAVRAAANEAAAAGRIGQTLDDALLMQIAAGLLDAALDAVQEGGDDMLLHRIGATFAELTDGAYTGVSSREDDRGMARLTLRLRDFPDEEAEVDQLSEGTRDQLFLALRMVAITDQAASGTVMPFVGDDILQSFDDQRAAAACRVLLRLSETTQVILLSHHEHLLGVLQKTLPPSAVHLRRVSGETAKVGGV